MKRSSDSTDSTLEPTKRRVLLPTSPPVTPTKNRIRDITNVIANSKSNTLLPVKKLVFSPQSPPTTPTKPKPKNSCIYSRAKSLFQKSSGILAIEEGLEFLTSRNVEGEKLNQFFKNNLHAKGKSASLYISGPPGTGKTAQTEISIGLIRKNFPNDDIRVVKINCMTILKPENIFDEIYNLIDPTSIAINKRKSCEDLFHLLCTMEEATKIVLILDELDYLITRDQQVLFQIFNYVRKSQGAKIIIVGISNALDLTSKFIPRLKSNNLSPESLQFHPYTAEQIKNICISKLQSLKGEDKENFSPGIPIIHPAALLLCCKKSASITGDLRKAFDICYKGIEMLEISLRKSEGVAKVNDYTLDNAPKVLISHIAKVCASSFGVDVNSRLSNLNLLQKAVLCSLVNLQTIRSGEMFSVNQFYDHYVTNSVDQSDKVLGRLKKGEFLEVIGALEATSVINLSMSNHSKGQEVSARLIRANVLYFDIQKAIGDIGVLQRILIRP